MSDRALWRRTFARCLPICVVAGFGAFLPAFSPENASAAALDPAAPGTPAAPANGGKGVPLDFVNQVNQSFSLRASQVVQIDLNGGIGQAIQVPVTINGQAYTLAMTPHSVRDDNAYSLKTQMADGSLVDVQPGPVNTLRGSLLELPDSMAVGGMLHDGLHTMIQLGDGQTWWLEAIGQRVAGAQPNQYALYRAEDIIHPPGVCGVADGLPPVDPAGAGGAGGEGGIAGATLYCAQIACDADFEFFAAHGSVFAVENRINLVINTLNAQYESQCDIRHVITTIIVRTTEPDPYDTTSPSGLLNQFAAHWNFNHTSIVRDVAHLFTGKNLSGGIIGIAALPGVCQGGSGYGLVQSDCCGNLGCSTDLSAHEIGHNWSAQHCSAACSSTMNAGLTCANTFLNSSPNSISQIVNYRNAVVGCLHVCETATLALPFTDNFDYSTINLLKWTGIDGAAIALALNPPSPPYALNLDGSPTGGNQVRSAIINTTAAGTVNFSYAYQRGGNGNAPETGDDLVVEYLNSSSQWVELNRHLGGEAAMSTFTPVTMALPSAAQHNGFRLRFRSISPETGLDDWFVDGVNIVVIAGPANNNCASAITIFNGPVGVTTVGATTDGPDETGACNFNGASQITNDVWYRYGALCTGTATITMCGANFNSKMAIYGGACPTSPGSVLACSDDGCGDDPSITLPVTAGQFYRLRIGGVSGASGIGALQITCTPTPQCPPDIAPPGGDNLVDVNDLLLVVGNWGATGTNVADVNGDEIVDVNDLLAIVGAWGPCT